MGILGKHDHERWCSIDLQNEARVYMLSDTRSPASSRGISPNSIVVPLFKQSWCLIVTILQRSSHDRARRSIDRLSVTTIIEPSSRETSGVRPLRAWSLEHYPQASVMGGSQDACSNAEFELPGLLLQYESSPSSVRLSAVPAAQ